MDHRFGFGCGEKNPKPTQSKKHKQKEQPTKYSIGKKHIINPKELRGQKDLPHSEDVVWMMLEFMFDLSEPEIQIVLN